MTKPQKGYRAKKGTNEPILRFVTSLSSVPAEKPSQIFDFKMRNLEDTSVHELTEPQKERLDEMREILLNHIFEASKHLTAEERLVLIAFSEGKYSQKDVALAIDSSPTHVGHLANGERRKKTEKIGLFKKIKELVYEQQEVLDALEAIRTIREYTPDGK